MAAVAIAHLGRRRDLAVRSTGRAPVAALIAGALGAVVSVIQRINAGKFTLDYDVGRPYAFFLGGLRPLIGGAFAIAIAFAFTGGLLHLPVAAASAPTTAALALLVLSFLAGFSERWAQDTLAAAGARRPAAKPERRKNRRRDGTGRRRAEPRRPAAARLRPHARSAADPDRRALQAARTRPDRQRGRDRLARPAAKRAPSCSGSACSGSARPSESCSTSCATRQLYDYATRRAKAVERRAPARLRVRRAGRGRALQRAAGPQHPRARRRARPRSRARARLRSRARGLELPRVVGRAARTRRRAAARDRRDHRRCHRARRRGGARAHHGARPSLPGPHRTWRHAPEL